MRPSKAVPAATWLGDNPRECGCNEHDYDMGGDFWQEVELCAEHQAERLARCKARVRAAQNRLRLVK